MPPIRDPRSNSHAVALLATTMVMLGGLLAGSFILSPVFFAFGAFLTACAVVFGLLAGVMLLTRKLDWYGVGKPEASSARG